MNPDEPRRLCEPRPEPGVSTRVEWHVEYWDPDPDPDPAEAGWRPWARCTGEPAARVALAEFREAAPHLVWRVVRFETVESVEDW